MKLIITNKRAFHDYTFEATYEAGIVLLGDEVKSIRAKQVSLNDAFATIHDSELMLINCHIAAYSHAYTKVDISRQTRKLLLKRKELNKLIGLISRRGYTLVPIKLYLNDRGYVKIELGLGKAKKNVDKKDALKERDIKRETQRDTKVRLR